MANRPTPVPLWPKAGVALPLEQASAFPAGEAVDFDPVSADLLLRAHGVTFVHWRALKCPIGVVDPDDERHPHGQHGDCSNGFLYKVVGPVTCAMGGNSDAPVVQDMGVFSQAQLTITAPRYYDFLGKDGEPLEVHLAPYDRMYMAEERIAVINWQLFEACGGPTDKLDYPLALVEHLVDAQGRELVEGQDFCIQDGLLAWKPSANASPSNPEAGTGAVYSIRYRYRPYFYVKDLPHEIRASQSTNPITGERSTQLLQQQALLQREYVFENQANDPEALDTQAQETLAGPKAEKPLAQALGQSNLRHAMAPRKGFGPR